MSQECLINQPQQLKVYEGQHDGMLLMVNESLKLHVEQCQVRVQF